MVPTKASTGRIVAALAAIYVIWGTTYLAIKLAIGDVEHPLIPPLLMSGIRWVVPGLAILAWTWARGVRPDAATWRRGVILGFLLLAVGNGAVALAETKMPSGVAALIVGTVPLWTAALEWVGGKRPTATVAVGLGAGLAGVAILSREGAGWSGGLDWRYLALPFFGSLGWAFGSLWSRRGAKPRDAWQDLGIQMVCGGVILFLLGAGRGELSQLHLASFTRTTVPAVAYLSVFGSVVALGCYLWLLRATTPAVATTYAFVNPAVAVLVGYLVLGEAVTALKLAATALIVAAVALIVWSKARKRAEPAVRDAAPEP